MRIPQQHLIRQLGEDLLGEGPGQPDVGFAHDASGGAIGMLRSALEDECLAAADLGHPAILLQLDGPPAHQLDGHDR